MKNFFFLLALIAAGQAKGHVLNPIKPTQVLKTVEYKYESAEFNISIVFPMAFEETLGQKEVEGKIQKKTSVKGSDGSGHYLASVTKHVVQMRNHVEMADISMNAFVETTKGEIKTQAAFMYKEHEGRDAVIYLPAQQSYVHYRVILIGDYQYQIVVVSDIESRSKAISDFFNSFKTLK